MKVKTLITAMKNRYDTVTTNNTFVISKHQFRPILSNMTCFKVIFSSLLFVILYLALQPKSKSEKELATRMNI
jgi:hypothetical protein